MIVVSHRGPNSFRREGEGFVARRGAGGLVSVLRPLLARDRSTTWVAAAIGEDDRAAVAAGAAQVPEFRLRLLAVDPELHRLHYDTFSNSILWFLHHGLFDLPREPRFDRAAHGAWDAYVAVNEAFADEVADHAPDGDTVLVQDYQLALVGGMLRIRRPDLRISTFTHIPFCGPNSIRVLPEPIATAMLGTMRTTSVGFHTERWARAYRACAVEVLGGDPPPAYGDAFCPDLEALRAEAATPEVRAAAAAFDELAAGRSLIVRSDRIEPSKNIVRGLLAFETLLEERPHWRDRAAMAVLVNPSRESIDAYRSLRVEIERTAERINERWGRGDRLPVILDARDDFARSLGGLVRADVLFVNPIKDGLNLVAKEGPAVNERDAPLCLSRDAGAFDELGTDCIPVQPYDIVQTAGALELALELPPDERRVRAARLRERIGARTPSDWLATQVARAS
ncbi:MAG: trehalose-6-phosphate synthase [Actinomycetes bacterium]